MVCNVVSHFHHIKLYAINDLHSYRRFPVLKKVREKSRECLNHKPQPIPDTKRKRKQTKPNKRKLNKRTKNNISSLFPSKVIAMLKGPKNTRTK